MAWRKRQEQPLEIPPWIGHDGFCLADWVEAGDFQLEPVAAESAARQRWIAARNAWLAGRPDAVDVLMEQLRQMAREVP